MQKRIFFDVMGVLFTVGDDTNDLLVPFVTARNKTITRAEICEEYCMQVWARSHQRRSGRGSV